MPQLQAAIVGHNNTRAAVTGQEELLVKVNNIGTITGVERTPTFIRRASVNGTVAAGTFAMSFASVGTDDALVAGEVLKPGETINFDAGAINNTLGAVTYDTLTNPGAELIIITLI